MQPTSYANEVGFMRIYQNLKITKQFMDY